MTKDISVQSNDDCPTPPNTRLVIIRAAGKLFAQKGYDGTSIRDIASEAKLPISSTVYHFGSKKTLYHETLRHFILNAGKLDSHFRFLQQDEIYDDPQAISNALRDTMHSFMYTCHGPGRAEHLIELYTFIMTGNDMEALALLLECFVPVQQLLPQVIQRIRPDFSQRDIEFWAQMFWSLLQYTVMGKKLVLYDMRQGSQYSEEFICEMAVRLAGYCCHPLGLPLPHDYEDISQAPRTPAGQ